MSYYNISYYNEPLLVGIVEEPQLGKLHALRLRLRWVLLLLSLLLLLLSLLVRLGLCSPRLEVLLPQWVFIKGGCSRRGMQWMGGSIIS